LTVSKPKHPTPAHGHVQTVADDLSAEDKFLADPVAGAATEARLATLEQLHLAAEARQIKGHRTRAEILADLVDAKEKLLDLIHDRDRLQIRADREAKLHGGQRKLAQEAWQRAGVPWDEAEWQREQKPAYTLPAAFGDTLHRQHYVVAKFEAELAALTAAIGAEAFA
jgi:hypothetical protein